MDVHLCMYAHLFGLLKASFPLPSNMWNTWLLQLKPSHAYQFECLHTYITMFFFADALS